MVREVILLELFLDHSRLHKSQGDLQVDRLFTFCHIFVQRVDRIARAGHLQPRSQVASLAFSFACVEKEKL